MKSSLQFMLTMIADIRSLPRPVFVLVLGQFINRFGAFVYPFLTLYLREKSFSFAEVSGVMAAFGAGNFCGPILGGYLADAIGRRNTLALSLGVSATLLIGMYFVDNYALLLCIAVLYGGAVFSFGPPASALLTDLVPEEQRVTAFALFRLAINAGFAIGPAVAGILYAKAPILIFLGDALTTYAFAALAILYLPHGLRSIAGRAISPKVVLKSWIEAGEDLVANIPFRRFLLSVLFMGVAFAQVFQLLSLYAVDRGLTTAVFGMLMGLNGLVIIIVEMPLTQWLKRLDYRHVLAVGYVLIGVGCGLFALAESVAGFVVAMVVFTLGEIAALPIGMAYSSSLAPENLRGRYFGFRGMTWASSNLLASVGVWLYGRMGPNWWVAAGVFGLVGAALILTGPARAARPAVGSATV